MHNNLSNKRKQLHAIEIGKGVQHVLEAASKILGNPILVHDMEYKVIAKTEMTVTDDPIWNEFESTGKVGPARLEFYKNECFFDMAANAQKITFLLSDKLKYDRIFGKIFNRDHIQVGCACMVACYQPFRDDDPPLFELVCDILSAELSRDDFFNKYGQAYLDILVGELIEAGIKDRGLYTAHVESIDMHLKDNIYLAVTDIDQCDSVNRLEYFRDLFKKTQPEFLYSIYSKYILIFISTDDAKLNIDNALKELNIIFIENGMRVGISSSFDNLYELNNYYVEAVNTVNYGAKTNNSKRIFLYGNIPAVMLDN